MNFLRDLDDRLFFAIISFARHTGWLHTFVLNFAKYGVVLFGAFLLIGVLHARERDTRTLAAAAWAGIATLLSLGVNQPINHIFREARPYVTHQDILVLASPSPDYSFPSDHAVMAGAAATGLLLVSRRWGIVAAIAAVFMAFARVYIAAHYPWDVVAGLIVGALVTGLGWIVLRAPLMSLTSWLRRQAGFRILFTPTTEPPASV